MSSAAEVYRRKQLAKAYMEAHVEEYDTATELAEACAEDQSLYADLRAYKIPEWVFEMAAEIMPEK
jgi:hypothetical protein